MTKNKKGLVILNTGDGKGKSTAAFGVVLRAWGRGMRICVIQFIKANTGQWGEVKAARKLGIEWLSTGDGFTWLSKDIDESTALAQHGWDLAKEKIASDHYDLIVLDEFTYLLHFGWLEVKETIAWLRENKPALQHLIITGRDAPPDLISFADLVTEMKAIKHPYELGVQAQAGIDY